MDAVLASKDDLLSWETSCIPMAAYEFVDKRVVPLVISAGFCELFGFDTFEEVYDLMLNDMYRDAHPEDVARAADAAYRFATEGGLYDVIYRTKDFSGAADYMILHAQGRHMYTLAGERVAIVWYTNEGPFVEAMEGADDVLGTTLANALRTESKVHTAYYDTLTGLPNMTYFFDLVEAGITGASDGDEPEAVLFLDLNGMKYFNQMHGFAEGDKLLRSVARILATQFGNENCGRLGQDHFAVVTSAKNLKKRVQDVIDQCATANEGLNLPVRVGIYLGDLKTVDIATACDRAKAACDINRNAYFSRYSFFDNTMLAGAKHRQYIVNNLDKAIQNHWIQAYYQPIVRATNGRVCDEEALARWVDPVQGFLSPADFIPILEETKLIYKLDLYMVEQVLAKMHRLREEGLYIVPASINLSRSDFEVCDIVEEVRRRVDESGIGRDMLSIEITESAIGSDYEFMKSQVKRLHDLGFKVWMDDFGSEYSSLDYLQSIPFDTIKLDMRFMQQFNRNDKSKIILTELVKMSIGLGLDTVSEGVEIQEQVDFLREIGCTKLQGYFYSKPHSLDGILERYRNGTQIGIENPDEADYFTAVGRINLYDMTSIAREEQDTFEHYFDMLPMAVYEVDDKDYSVLRCNQSYRDFMERVFGGLMVGVRIPFTAQSGRQIGDYLQALKRCGQEGGSIVLDGKLQNGATVHSLIRRIAVNPVTGMAAVAVLVLAH
ncbi:MAG: EAL domain-containing protein [Atopobiaceae bacterium]|nr:EAL domain-containing protein [Atopobiaceae bacterium]